MMIKLRNLTSVRCLPNDVASIKRKFGRENVQIGEAAGWRRPELAVRLCDLPAEVRHAYLEQCVGDADLDMGQYDDAAHDAFLKAPATMRAEAERKAAMARVMVAFGDAVPWGVKLKSIRAKFGTKGASKQSLQRVLRAVEGVDPINFAPALLAKFKPNNAVQADVTDKAWAMFMTTIRDAAPTFPLTQAWRDVRDVATVQGWNWPSYPTIWRRWEALPEAQRQAARFGTKDAVKRLTQPALRNKTTIRPLQYLSLDGRTQDYWTDMGAGKPVRLTMLALIDVASNMVLGYELASSENANSTVRLIRQVCERYGIFDTLYTDNGSSFAGHLVAGGVDHKFRNSRTHQGMRPLGICHHLKRYARCFRSFVKRYRHPSDLCTARKPKRR